MKYDVQYFIGFFEATSIGEWTTGEYDIRDKQLEEANIKTALELVNTIEEPNNLLKNKVLASAGELKM